MKTPVFEFIQLRNPQTVSSDDKRNFFVSLSLEELSLSHFFRGLQPNTYEFVKGIIETRAVNFNQILSPAAMKATYSSLLSFYSEIHSERFRNNWEGLDEVLTRLNLGMSSRLSQRQRVQLFDNLVHRMWILTADEEIQRICAILIADKFLELYLHFSLTDQELTEIESSHLNRLIKHGKVLIEFPLSRRYSGKRSQPPLSIVQRDILLRAHEQLVRKAEGKELDRLILAFDKAVQDEKEDLVLSSETERNQAEAELMEVISGLNVETAPENLNSILPPKDTLSSSPILLTNVISRLAAPDQSMIKRMVDLDKDDLEAKATLANRASNLELTTSIEKSINQMILIDDLTISTEESIPHGSWSLKAPPY